MDTIISQAIELLKESSGSVLATPEEFDYFSPSKKPVEKKPAAANLDPEMRQMVAKILPDMPLTSAIPDDGIAKKRAHLYQEKHLAAKVLVLSLGETGPALQFLQNVTKAIDTLLAPARLIEMRKIERENTWELTLNSPSLQLVLTPPFTAWKNLTLARFYRENPSSKTHFLRETSLLFLQPIASYLKNPDLKRELWKSLSSQLSTST
jgi:hypothetical protein